MLSVVMGIPLIILLPYRKTLLCCYIKRCSGIEWRIPESPYSLLSAIPSWITTECKILQFSVRPNESQIAALGNLSVKSER